MVAAAVFAVLCLALLWRLIDMPVWRAPRGVYKCPGGPVYAGANDPCCPIGSSLSPSPSVAPSMSPSPSVLPSVSPSPSVAPSPSPSGYPFPGSGWYCIAYYDGGPTCQDIVLRYHFCAAITTAEQWAAYQFGTCIYDGGAVEWMFYTTDLITHAAEEDCQSACATP